MQSNLQIAMRTMKVISLLDKQIKDLGEMMDAILADEGIICFHLHHELLYHNALKGEDHEPYEDLVDDKNGYKTPQGQIIVMPNIQMPADMMGQMLTPDQLRMLTGAAGIRPNDHPKPRQSKTYKLNVSITAQVLQIMLNGFKQERQKCIEKLIYMGLDIFDIIKEKEEQ